MAKELKVETVEEFLARGGEITTLRGKGMPRHTNWSPREPIFQHEETPMPTVANKTK